MAVRLCLQQERESYRYFAKQSTKFHEVTFDAKWSEAQQVTSSELLEHVAPTDRFLDLRQTLQRKVTAEKEGNADLTAEVASNQLSFSHLTVLDPQISNDGHDIRYEIRFFACAQRENGTHDFVSCEGVQVVVQHDRKKLEALVQEEVARSRDQVRNSEVEVRAFWRWIRHALPQNAFNAMFDYWAQVPDKTVAKARIEVDFACQQEKCLTHQNLAIGCVSDIGINTGRLVFDGLRSTMVPALREL